MPRLPAPHAACISPCRNTRALPLAPALSIHGLHAALWLPNALGSTCAFGAVRQTWRFFLTPELKQTQPTAVSGPCPLVDFFHGEPLPMLYWPLRLNLPRPNRSYTAPVLRTHSNDLCHSATGADVTLCSVDAPPVEQFERDTFLRLRQQSISRLQAPAVRSSRHGRSTVTRGF